MSNTNGVNSTKGSPKKRLYSDLTLTLKCWIKMFQTEDWTRLNSSLLTFLTHNLFDIGKFPRDAHQNTIHIFNFLLKKKYLWMTFETFCMIYSPGVHHRSPHWYCYISTACCPDFLLSSSRDFHWNYIFMKIYHFL